MTCSLADWYAAGTRQRVGGHTLFVCRAGDGPHLTLLHGFPTCSWDWSKIWPDLAARRALLAHDLLGFGHSDKPATTYSFADHADRLQALWRADGVDRTTLVAHDYSVTLALEVLARRADGTIGLPAIDGVVFLNGALRGHLHRPRPIQRLLRSFAGPLVARLLNRARFGRAFSEVFTRRPTESELDDFWASIRTRNGHRRSPALLHYIDDRLTHAARWESALDGDGPPRTFVWGMNDPVSGAHVVESVRDCGRVVELAVGHYPQWEAPDRVAAAILEVTS